MSKFKNLIGNTYGELTVIEMLKNHNGTGRTYCKCIGDNGCEYVIRQDALQSGATKHVKGAARAGKADNIANKRFGKLTALYPTNRRKANSSIVWHCICDCGNYVDVSCGDLNRGHTTSCGCNKRSEMEKYIASLFEDKGVHYKSEKTFPDLLNPDHTMHLYFDFYLYKYNTVIEYDGELHYVPYELFGGEPRLRKIKLFDSIKDDYCKSHKITMIRLNYKQSKEEIKEIIDNIICP